MPAALAALAQLSDPAHLLIVGDDRDIECVQGAWRASIGVREPRDVRRIPGRRRARTTARADAFVLPALYDSFPDAAMEALACGLPVVTSTRSGAAELVTEHDAGFVCDSRDVERARRGTCERCRTRRCARALGANARRLCCR